MALSFELNRSQILKLNKVSVDIVETKIEEIVVKKEKKGKTDSYSDMVDDNDEEPADEEPADEESQTDEPTEEQTEEKTEETSEEQTDETVEEPKEKETKTVEVPHSFDCKIEEEIHGVNLLSKDAIKDAKKRITALEKRDEDKLKNEQAKNDFETLIYGFRDWLNDSDNDQFVTSSEKDEQNTNLGTESEWLYDEGDDAGFKEYQKRGYEL